MRGFVKFNKGLFRLPLPIKMWLFLLVAANLIAPVLFLRQVEAQVAIATFMASACLMSVLTGCFGFNRLLGLGHILWLPMLVWLWLRLDQIQSSDAFGFWIRGLMGLNGMSLVMDASDVVRYIAGDRKELVEGI